MTVRNVSDQGPPERSEVEGPAVLSATSQFSMEAPPSPLSSRAQPRACPERSRRGPAVPPRRQPTPAEAPS